jgi:hypothetical protein
VGAIPMRYLQGLGGRKTDGELQIEDSGVKFFITQRQPPRFSLSWDQVRSINFDDPGRTKANGASIFAFGVLGMASRKAFTIVTVVTVEAIGYLEAPWPVGTWNSVVPQILHEVPAASGKLFVNGRDFSKPVGSEAARSAPDPAEQLDPIEQIARLGELRDKGLLSPGEFEAKKQELMKRI